MTISAILYDISRENDRPGGVLPFPLRDATYNVLFAVSCHYADAIMDELGDESRDQ